MRGFVSDDSSTKPVILCPWNLEYATMDAKKLLEVLLELLAWLL